MSSGSFINPNGWIKTKKGNTFAFWQPDYTQIDIEDIAHALSHLCRFNGHCNKFYSVAQHSVIVSRLCPEAYALEGLLHDATEAYCGDLIRPIKKFLPSFKEIEDRIEKAVWKKFKLCKNKRCMSAVKNADNIALVTEARDLLSKECTLDYDGLEHAASFKIKPLSSLKARELFLKEYEKLCL